MEINKRIPDFDGIEVLRVSNQKTSFPEHFHGTFCISLIEDGLEAIQMGDMTLFSEKGTISINNPHEIHANPMVNKDVSNGFTTLYLPPSAAEYLLGKQDIYFSHQQKFDPQNLLLFQKITRSIVDQNTKGLQDDLQSLLSSFELSSETKEEPKKVFNRKWTELQLLIEDSLEDKIRLDDLATFMGMNRYNFAKEFRARYGLSPINFVMMKKIFKAKDLIAASTNLTQLAYKFDFFDQAHFSRHFKRFIGLSPREFKKQLK